jgi:lysine-N-methylase
MSQALQSRAVETFVCLGDACEDTCCKGWGMQLTRETVAKYEAEAPELLESVTSGEAEFIMKRDATTDYCVKFDAGWCGIHKRYGSDMLGDACHFYPRITRAVGETVLTTAALSCPESARRMLLEEGGFDWVPRTETRVPFSMKQYLPEGMQEAEMLALHALFLREAGNPAHTAEENLLRLVSVVQSLSSQPMTEWGKAAPFFFTMAAGRLPKAEAAATDPFNLAHALHGLVGAAKASNRPRLMQTIASIAEVLGITFEGAGIALSPDAAQRFLTMQHHWRQHAPDGLLGRYLQAQMSVAFFPFAGLGASLDERITIIGVRFATVKLALMAEAKRAGGALSEESTIRAVQSLSRFLDHLADPTLSLQIYHEAGWTRPSRLRGLLME